MAVQAVKTGGFFKSFGRYSFLSLSTLFKIVIKHWYISVFLIIMLPAIIGSVQTAIETKNPIHPALQLAKRIFVADIAVKEDVTLLQEQGVEAMVGMPKPTEGIWAGVKYKWFYFWRVIFRLFGNVWLIFVPLIVTYRILKLRNISEVNKNVFLSVIIFLIYLFITNALFVTYNVATGQTQIIFPEGASEYKQMWYLFLNFLPLNGLVSLVKYLITSAIT